MKVHSSRCALLKFQELYAVKLRFREVLNLQTLHLLNLYLPFGMENSSKLPCAKCFNGSQTIAVKHRWNFAIVKIDRRLEIHRNSFERSYHPFNNNQHRDLLFCQPLLKQQRAKKASVRMSRCNFRFMSYRLRNFQKAVL